LKSFYFQELHRSNSPKSKLDCLEHIKINPSRLQSMLFFGLIDQVIKNKMRVAVFYDDYKLIDIRMETGQADREKPTKLELHGWCTFKIRSLLLETEQFQRISINDMLPVLNPKVFVVAAKSNLAIKEEEQDIEWPSNIPSNATCTSLQLINLSLINLNEGRMFQNFEKLSELHFQGRMDSQFSLIIDINILPRTIKRLILSEVTVRAETQSNEIWKLEYLWFQICQFLPNFKSRFHKILHVEHLTISQAEGIKRESFRNPKLFFPNIQFVSELTNNSPNWKSLRCDYFQWTVSADESDIGPDLWEMKRCLEAAAKRHNVPEHHPTILISRNSSNSGELIMKKLTRVIFYFI